MFHSDLNVYSSKLQISRHGRQNKISFQDQVSVLQDNVRVMFTVSFALRPPVELCGDKSLPRGPFLESPETFRAHFG